MQTAKPDRADIAPSFFSPIAPHLRESAVLKMLHEEEPSGKVKGSAWPPAGSDVSHKPSGFFSKVSRGQGGRPVEWPPRPEKETNNQVPANDTQKAPPVPPRPANYPQVSMEQAQHQQQMTSQQQQQQQHQQMMSQQQQRQQVENAPNMTTTYPSGFKLREQAPVEQQPARVVTSQPAFKMTTPIKKSGDSKWPPKGGMIEPTQDEVREFIKPRKSNKDYSEFFAKNALPQNYAVYRPPPGTQHHGEEEEEGVSNM